MCEHCQGTTEPHCEDCGQSIIFLNGGRLWGKHYYMVQKEIWQKWGNGPGYLCMDCLEKRMGRKLTIPDFTNVAANYLLNPYVMNLLGISSETAQLLTTMKFEEVLAMLLKREKGD